MGDLSVVAIQGIFEKEKVNRLIVKDQMMVTEIVEKCYKYKFGGPSDV